MEELRLSTFRRNISISPVSQCCSDYAMGLHSGDGGVLQITIMLQNNYYNNHVAVGSASSAVSSTSPTAARGHHAHDGTLRPTRTRTLMIID